MQAIDLFWSFRSPYSYLAISDVMNLLDKFCVDVLFRPVLPLALRDPDFFTGDNLKRARYVQIDWPRRAEMLGLSHIWPSPDPVNQDLTTFKISDQQPYIYRLTYLGVEAQRRGRGVQFACEVSKLLFSGVKDWHLGEHLKNAAHRAGLNLEEMDIAIVKPESHQKELDENHRGLETSGMWGVPTFVFNGEPFWGQDRIDSLCWRLEKAGLKRKV